MNVSVMETIRRIHTGIDPKPGAAALQTGKMFSILMKPYPPERFKKTIEDGIEAYHAKGGRDPEDSYA